MCGICGQYHYAGGRPVARATVEAMTAAIAHRGPDDAGHHFAPGFGLGFRRLSIIDLAGGHQPMADADGTVHVAFNGEIYNFRELRRELEAAGHAFRTRSDTEVIVHGYRHWGTGVLDRLDGMFGLAIWDAPRRRLVLARDAAGIKPVYYRVDGGTVTFGSELRAILAALPAHPELDLQALNLFLRYRYVPAPLTPYAGIRKLASGTMAVFEDGGWRVERWRRPAAAIDRAIPSDGEAVEELLAVYDRALERHLVADVPVGLLLSGGVDSGLLLALMSRRGRGWPTYTVGYGRQAYADDELADAAATARTFGARHTEVRIDRAGFEAALAKAVAVVEEPVAASSIVPMWFVCARAREDVKVALVGQGPDELFGGYRRHLGVHYGAWWRRTPPWLRAVIEGGVQRLPRTETLKRGAGALATPDRLERYRDVFSVLPGPAVDRLFRPGLLESGAGDRVCELWAEVAPEACDADELGGFQALELRSSLPDELLLYADKLSMAHGLEVRVPYLDREIVDYAARLPASFKIRHGRRKWLHRRACERLLPAEMLARKKRGFAVDAVDRWFRESLDGKLGAYLLDPAAVLYRYLDPAPVSRLLDEHRAGRHDRHKMLFSLVVLEEWLRTCAAASATRRPAPALVGT
ncbi:MAG: asparagine synthase (glutamine-hydrolyzing) [Steroidobacteraceae bacterium]|jgi:asparagine synthase (glutamine-hydrolysing)|nr:asparagine synthase (glutamine-hydrolyzing) [Steroidobacteraceae bacterium]